MRKKAHIKLASMLADSVEDYQLNRYKFWCKVGSILPDIVPTFLWKRHRIDTTNKEFEKAVFKFLEGNQLGRLHSIRAGIISHYLSDYFTFPHNKEFTFGFKSHNSYEGRQLQEIKSYSDNYLEISHLKVKEIHNIESLFLTIENIHEEYIKKAQTVSDWLKIDLYYIMFINYLVLTSLVQNREILLEYIHSSDYQMIGAY